jgi:hypothetical protein
MLFRDTSQCTLTTFKTETRYLCDQFDFLEGIRTNNTS